MKTLAIISIFFTQIACLLAQDTASGPPIEERIPKELAQRRDIRDLQLRLTLLRRNSERFGERHPQYASIKEQILKLEEELAKLIREINPNQATPENLPSPPRDEMVAPDVSIPNSPTTRTRDLRKALGMKERPAWVQPNVPKLRTESPYQWQPLPPSGYQDAFVKIGAFPTLGYLWGIETLESGAGTAWVTWQSNSPTRTRQRLWSTSQSMLDAVLDADFAETGRIFLLARSKDDVEKLELSYFVSSNTAPFAAKSSPVPLGAFQQPKDSAVRLLPGPSGTVFCLTESKEMEVKDPSISVYRPGENLHWISIDHEFRFDEFESESLSRATSPLGENGVAVSFQPMLYDFDKSRNTLWRLDLETDPIQLDPIVRPKKQSLKMPLTLANAKKWTHLLIDSSVEHSDYGPRIYLGSTKPTHLVLIENEQGKTLQSAIATTSRGIKQFGISADGIPMAQDDFGQSYRLVLNNPSYTKDLPNKLSQLNLFSDLGSGKMGGGFISYSVREDFAVSSDHNPSGFAVERWVGVPSGRVEFNDSEDAVYTEGTMFVQNFRQVATDAKKGRLMETRILIYQSREWFPFVYGWNEDQTDAQLVESSGSFDTVSRDACLACHQQPNNQFILGFKPSKLSELHSYTEGEVALQYRTLIHLGIVP